LIKDTVVAHVLRQKIQKLYRNTSSTTEMDIDKQEKETGARPCDTNDEEDCMELSSASLDKNSNVIIPENFTLEMEMAAVRSQKDMPGEAVECRTASTINVEKETEMEIEEKECDENIERNVTDACAVTGSGLVVHRKTMRRNLSAKSPKVNIWRAAVSLETANPTVCQTQKTVNNPSRPASTTVSEVTSTRPLW
jgi:hypothetical protein